MRAPLACLLAASLAAAPAPSRGDSAARRPLLVTMDDLPIAAGRLHPSPEERARTTRGLLAALDQHVIRAAAFLEARGRTLRFFRFPLLREGDTGKKLDAIAHGRREEEVRRDVAAALDRQVQAWNRGDLEAFVSVYAEDASFVSPSGLTLGRQAVLDRYRKRYPDKAAMGTLSLEVLETRFASGIEGSMLGDAVVSGIHGASVIARWTLAYPDKPAASGLTLLVLRPRGDGWAIVQDASM